MPRDQYRDDFDDLPARKKSGSNAGLIIALVVGGVLLLLCLPVGGIALVWMLGARGGAEPPVNNAAADTAPAPEMGKAAIGKGKEDGPKGGPARKVYLREEFKALVIGKTEAEVRELLGAPDSTSEQSVVVWSYKGVTRDPVTMKIDFSVSLVISKGRVVNFSFI